MKLALPRVLIAASWFVFGSLLWLAFQKPWGQLGFFVFTIVGAIPGALITWAVLVGRLLLFFPFPLCRQGKCRRMGVIMCGGPTRCTDSKGKAYISTSADVETNISVTAGDSWSSFQMARGILTKDLLAFANGQTT